MINLRFDNFLRCLSGLSLAAGCSLLAASATAAEPTVLIDFSDDWVTDRLQTNDTQVERFRSDRGPALRVVSGTESKYPNVKFRPAGKNSARWDIARHTAIEIDVENLGDTSVRLIARVDSPPQNGRRSIGGKVSLAPRESGTIVCNIDRQFAMEMRERLHGMQATPWGKRASKTSSGIDPAEIRDIQVYLAMPKESYTFAVLEVRAVGEFDPSTQVIPEPFFPFVDEFGQYIHADWPNKVASTADLRDAADRETSEVKASPRPDSWNQYGGWADGPQLEATGHFRTEKVDGAWHLVDPEGRLFFSMGIDCVRFGSITPIDQGRDGWFRDAPWLSDNAGMQGFLGEGTPRRNDYAKKTVQTFNFGAANLLRKYGEDWEQQWLDRTPARLMNWGFNTIATWSDPRLFENTSIPYTHWVYINPPKLPWQPGTRNRIADPFNPNFEHELRRRITNMTEGTADDPWCIGYFLDNELSWGEEDHLARGLLKAKPNQVAKQKMFAWLQEQYGDIAVLNAAWGVDYAGWDAAVQGESDPQTDAARADLVAFNAQIAESYFSQVRDMFRRITPNKLYLGCRFAKYNPQVARIAAEYADVVSFNVYRDTIDGWRPLPDFDRPIIIGEYHFGTRDRGAFNTGLVQANSTQHKAEMFQQYLRSAVKNPLVVGAHWFQLNDQPTTGRVIDGENHGIGFVSITDTPHAEMIEASRTLARNLYTAEPD